MTTRLDDPLAKKAREICGDRVFTDFELAPHAWWKIGGPVRVLAMPASVEELRALRRLAAEMEVRTLVIGEMSNLLIADKPIDAMCIRIGSSFSGVSFHDESAQVTAQSGAWVPGLARALQRNAFTGLEHICGIPGTLGGLVMMNGGSLRCSIGTNIVSVTSIANDGSLVTRDRNQCEFSYRDSVFAASSEIIAEVRMQLKRGDKDEIRREMKQILQSRRLKFPRKQPNCGSVFKSNPAAYAEFGPPGAMIEKMGWKGEARGGAQVSPLHANFIVNRGDASTADILDLIGQIQTSVEAGIGHHMVPEVRVVRSDGRVQAADTAYADWRAGERL